MFPTDLSDGPVAAQAREHDLELLRDRPVRYFFFSLNVMLLMVERAIARAPRTLTRELSTPYQGADHSTPWGPWLKRWRRTAVSEILGLGAGDRPSEEQAPGLLDLPRGYAPRGPQNARPVVAPAPPTEAMRSAGISLRSPTARSAKSQR